MILQESTAILYLPIVILFSIAMAVAIILTIIPMLFAPKESKPTQDKFAPYECGFDPIVTSSGKFNISFYMVAILFIVFDLEIMFLIPWAVNFKNIDSISFFSMMVFLSVLTIGFIYEWKKDALNWH